MLYGASGRSALTDPLTLAQSQHYPAATLYVVATPIGNVADISLRALHLLGLCDRIAAEDTRNTSQLLSRYGISKPLLAAHDHNEHQAAAKIVDYLRAGERVAFVSDAGTPGISDPGFLLVRECLAKGLLVECLPGPTAFVPALLKSGFGAERFSFEGFLPVKKGRQTRYKLLAEEERTIIFYESPHRIMKTLDEMATYWGADRQISVSRELTKMFEETVRGTVEEVKAYFETHPAKGEFVVCVKGKE